jgi:hypothetical protein
VDGAGDETRTRDIQLGIFASLYESGMFDKLRWIVIFTIVHAGCRFVERRFHPRRTSVKKLKRSSPSAQMPTVDPCGNC